MPIQETMMRGGTNLRKIISTYLAAAVPPAIDIMISQNDDLDTFKLPYPKVYDSSDPTETDEYPFMGSFLSRENTVSSIDTLPTGAVEIQSNYEISLFVTGKTALLGLDLSGIPKYETPYRNSALRMRDDLMAVLKNVIFNSPSLGTAGTAYRANIDLQSWNPDYPEPMKRGSDANPVWICAGVVTLNVSLIEHSVVPYIGYVNTLNTELEKLS